MLNTTSDKFWGPTIAINDTWAYDVDIQNYTPSADGTYTAELRVILYDHFGLDVPDLDISLWKPFKPYGLAGLFRAWFILQHVRGYRPFITVIDTIHPIEGRFR